MGGIAIISVQMLTKAAFHQESEAEKIGSNWGPHTYTDTQGLDSFQEVS